MIFPQEILLTIENLCLTGSPSLFLEWVNLKLQEGKRLI